MVVSAKEIESHVNSIIDGLDCIIILSKLWSEFSDDTLFYFLFPLVLPLILTLWK